MLDTVRQELRHGIRLLAKNPGFAVIATVSIAIGVGANTAMFSIADGLILRPLAVPAPRELVTVASTTPTGDVDDEVSYPEYADIRSRAGSFNGLAASRGIVASFAYRRDDPAQGKFGLAVSGNFFDVLRVRPLMGRAFLPDDDRIGNGRPVVVLAHETWTQQFDADPMILGREIRLTGESFTVIGVAPEGFTGNSIFVPPAFYVPLAMLPALQTAADRDVLERRDARIITTIGRLKHGVSLAQANGELDGIARSLQQDHPETNERRGLLLRTELNARFAQFAPAAATAVMLIVLAVAILLVACANVAGLMTSRAPARARELAVRLAIGGTRARLVRQMLTEGAVIAVAGGAAGIVLGYLAIRSFRQFQIVSDIGVRLTYSLDGRALIVALTATMVGALLSSAIPAWRNTRARDLSSELRHTVVPADRLGRLFGRHGLVALQVALTLVLLAVATSFYRAFEASYGQGPGFRTNRLLLTSLDPALARYDQNQTNAFFERLRDRVENIPGVSSVALTSFFPLSQDGASFAQIVPEGLSLPRGVRSLRVATARVDERYFNVTGIPIVVGRGFDATDTQSAPRVAIVSRGMAARYWPGQNPVGRRIRVTDGQGEWTQVIGVAADVKFRLFTPASTPFLYLSSLQYPVTRNTIVIATRAASASVAADVRAAIRDAGADVPILGLRTIEDFYYASGRNLNTVLVRTVAAMGITGLMLAITGLYGLTAYLVSRRTREIGVRIAVGALPSAVLRMVLRQGAGPSLGGVALGVLASVLVGRVLQSAIPGTGGDAVTYALTTPLVVLVVVMAAYIPARRAARIDPIRALRQD